MQLKTFRARSMAQALAEVKKDLGKDAVILHTRAYRVGAVMGMGGHDEYEITAADTLPPNAAGTRTGSLPHPGEVVTLSESLAVRGPTIKEPRSARALATPVNHLTATGAEDFVPSSYTSLGIAAPVAAALQSANRSPVENRPEARPESRPESRPETQPDPRAQSKVELKPTREAIASRAIPSASALAQSPVVAPQTVALSTPVTFAPTDDQAMNQLKDELGSIRRLVGQLLTETRRAGASSAPLGSLAGSSLAHVGQSEPLLEQSLRLQEAGIRPELIDRVVGGVRDELSPDELADTQIVSVAVQRHVASMLPVAGAVARAGNRPHPHTGAPRPLVIALIGPTGVGKTTTIAKLAATYALKHGAKVGLITCDTYRIAAVDQLRTYAGIMDMPMKVALTPREAMEAAESLSDCGVILVDSAGRSPQDSVRLEEMGAFLEALAPEQTHLVLNVGAAEDALTHAATRFSTLQPTHLLLTKLDEAVRYGVLVNLVQAVGLKISYVTTGQEVPAQIELAQPERLARLVLEAKLWRTS